VCPAYRANTREFRVLVRALQSQGDPPFLVIHESSADLRKGHGLAACIRSLPEAMCHLITMRAVLTERNAAGAAQLRDGIEVAIL
jgi:hypothetical protein